MTNSIKSKEKAIEIYLGKTIERLTIIEILNSVKGKSRYCKAKCVCGVIKTYRLGSIGKGIKSCGCWNKEVLLNHHLQNNKLACKYNYNEDFFKTITPESSYFLGYLYSDGCLASGSNCISINSTDEEILIKLNNLISEDIIVKKTSEKINNNQAYYRLQITNKEIYKDLLNLGLYPNKSLTLTIPNFLKLNKDFWRGMIDGDGCCFLRKDEKFVLGFCGTQEICKDFMFFVNTIIKTNNKIQVNSKSGLNFAVSLHGNKALVVHKYLYENSNISMNRKSKFNYLYDSIDKNRLLRPYKVKQLDLEGNLIKIWDSVQMAAKELNIKKQNIQGVLGNQPSSVCNNFKWEYVHKENKKYKKEIGIFNIRNNNVKFRGVTKLKNTYSVTITYNKKKYVFYDFKTSEEAAKYYDRLNWKYLKKEQLLNFNYNKYSDIEDIDIEIKKPSSKEHYKSPSKFIGINNKKFIVLIPINGKTTYYGSFKSKEEAIKKRDEVLELLLNNKLVIQ